jgi:PAS domain S-box-containing protein
MTSNVDSPLELQQFFDAAPGLFLVLAPDSPRFTILAATDAYLQATLKRRSDIVGRGLFEVFPGHGANHEGQGAQSTRASLVRAMAARVPDVMAPQRHDIARPEAAGGGFDERHWRSVNSPVFNASGELACLIHSVEDVTESVRASQQADAKQGLLDSGQAPSAQTSALPTAKPSLRESRRVTLNLIQGVRAARQQAEHSRAELQASAQWLRLATDAAGLGIWTWQPEGDRITWENDKPYAMLGIAGSDAPLTAARLAAEFVHPDDRAAFERAIADTAQHGARLYFQGRFNCPDGALRWIEFTGQSVPGNERSSLRVVGTIQDITERKQSEQAQARLATIVESSEDAIISKSIDGIIQTWNAGAERMFGYPAEDMVGKPITLLIPPERLPEEEEILQQLRRGQAIKHYETLRLTRDGRRIDVSLTTSPLKDARGNVVGASKIVRNITERKQAEGGLRESEQRFRAVVTASSDLMCRMSPDWSEMRQLYDKRSIVDSNVPNANWLESYVYRDDQPRLMTLVKEAIRGKRIFEMEHRVMRVDGSVGWMLSRAVPLLDAKGEVVEWFGTGSDVTEQKRAEQALRESEARYHGLFNSIDEGFCVVEMLFDENEKATDYRFLEVNPAFEQQAGLKDATGQRIREIAPQHDEYWFEMFGQVALTGEPKRFVNEANALGDRWFDTYAFRLGGPESSRVAVLFRDITERIRRERNLGFIADLDLTLAGIGSCAELLQEATRRIAEYLQLRHCLLTEIDQVSGQATVLHEYLAAGAPALERVRPLTELRTAAQRQLLAAGKTLVSTDVLLEGRGAVELQRLAARGVRSQVTAPYVVDGQWKFLLTALRAKPYVWPQDEVELITELAARVYVHVERARAQEALLQSEERLRLAADAAHFGMYDRDLAGAHFHVSAEIKKMLGYEPDEPLSHAQVMSHISPDDQRAGLDAFLRACDPGGDGQIAIEQRIVRSDGTVRWISSVGRVLFEDGLPRRSIGFWVDITERMHLQRATLEQAQALAELDRRKDEFLAMLSHELRNPLAAMANAAHLLRLQANEGPVQQQGRGVIERQIGHLRHLVDDLLEVSRITTGSVRLRQEPVSVHDIVQRAVETAQPLIAQRRQQLEVLLPPQAIFLHADVARMEQVLVNLLNNAAKYTDEGGHIWLTVELDIAAGAAANGAVAVPMVALRVRDTGIGISPELLPHVFDLFTQADRSLDRSQGGLGIGLCLVQRLVELHGGTVEAHSVLGQGSEFVVRLPVMLTAQSVLPSPPPATTPGVVKGCRVLVVDDNVDAAQSLAKLLEMTGHETRLAYDGPSALEAAIDYRPDVVLLDIGLPGLSGFEVARQIRQQAALSGIVLVALTGYGQDSDRQLSKEAGFDYHLVKPASFSDIEQILASVSARVT